ncbi:hypothetical protein GCM10025876_36790 [Demequina litorisediminis]|uniref:Uncharacterized protein n=1 Tax=Demequina litorisediminis TaxID=1849022 RepID=A0ABQ6II41_9MICO|nr:hypothetical protein GCM10025876_36790 [Demequina litorisediminis]
MRFLSSLDDLRLDLLTDVGGEVAHTTHLDERGGEEAAQTDVHDQTALDDLDHGAGHDAVLVLDLLDRTPCTLVLGTLLREDQATLLVLLLEDERLDGVANVDNLIGVGVVADRQARARG